jgi:type II secretory pathway pseudopilin PulG
LRRNKQSGMTLVEALIAVFIFSVVVGLTVMSFTAGQMEWNVHDAQLDIYQSLRLAMDGMAREIRQSTPGNIDINGSGDAINFSISGSQIRYYLDDENLMREHPEGAIRTLVQNITALHFDMNGTVVTFTVGSNKTVTGRDIGMELTEKVSLRNEDE